MVVGSLGPLVCFILLLLLIGCRASCGVRQPSLGLLTELFRQLLVLDIRFLAPQTHIWPVVGSRNSPGRLGVVPPLFVGGIGDFRWWLLPCRRCSSLFHWGTCSASVIAFSALLCRMLLAS